MDELIKILPEIETVEPDFFTENDFFGRISAWAAGREGTVILLSGGESDSAKYNILAAEPWLTIRSRGRRVKVTIFGEEMELENDPLNVLETITACYEKDFEKIPVISRLPVTSGLFGYFSYDLKDYIENIQPLTIDDLYLPDLYLVIPQLVVLQEVKTGETRGFLIKTHRNRNKTLADITGDIQDTAHGTFSIANTGFKSNFEKEEYERALSLVINYIKEGDIYQVNISQRFTACFEGDSYSLFKELFKENPAAFFAYINCGDHEIISTSPERFILKEGNRVEARPIKGTRPRGTTPDEDRRLMEDLALSTKDDAELSMIVDLLRNDIGKVCKAGSVKVVKHKALESYKNVHHLVSTVEGYLEKGKNSIDLLKAAFPGGSITGCPKVRSMEIIEEIEPFKRHIYTGSIGYIGFNGRMDLSIAIRTATVTRGKILFSSGGGIVYDSDPEQEYFETLHKGKSIMGVLDRHKKRSPENGFPIGGLSVPLVWHNGKFTTSDRAFVSPFSQGHRYGQGVFETIRVKKGKVEYLEEHISRLDKGSRFVIGKPLPPLDWEGIVQQLVSGNRLADRTAVLRIWISAGGQGLFDTMDITASCTEYTKRLALIKGDSLNLGVYPHKRENILSDYKTMNYLFYKKAGEWAAENGFDEALILNSDGSVSETNTGNILMEEKMLIIIPDSGHRLEGVMEGKIIEEYRRKGYKIVRKIVSPEELGNTKTGKIFVTNSLLGKVRARLRALEK